MTPASVLLSAVLALGAVHSLGVPQGRHPGRGAAAGGVVASGGAPLQPTLDSGTVGATGAGSVLHGVRTGRTGVWTHMGPGYPADYMALPIGPGKRVVACGPARCLTLVSTDAGPNRAALQRGVIGDLSVALFRRLCSCSETRGTFRGSWRLAGPELRLPDTSTEAP